MSPRKAQKPVTEGGMLRHTITPFRGIVSPLLLKVNYILLFFNKFLFRLLLVQGGNGELQILVNVINLI